MKVADLASRGISLEEVSERLGIDEMKAKDHLGEAMSKLGVQKAGDL